MPSPSIRQTARIGLSPRFHVSIDGIDLGGWSKCEGLAVTFKTMDYVPLGHNGFLPVLPDRVTYDKITLQRAVNDVDTPKLMRWLAERAGGAADGTGGIALLGTDGAPVMIWHLRGVYPTQWKGPGMDASSKNIAIETLQLAHEGFLEA
jgi:phage tail-like protein